METELFKELLTDTGQEVIQAAMSLNPVEENFLGDFSALSRRFPRALARAALEIAILRLQAQGKFPDADRMYFTRPALEQASSSVIATYRARRYRQCSLVADLGCSIGSDTLAFTQVAPAIGIDLDPLRLAMAQANLSVTGLSERAAFVQADLRSPLPIRIPPELGLFFDPARRSAQQRAYSVRDYQPPLTILENWLPQTPALGVKISPGVNLDELNRYDAEIEFISLNRELKEAVLWFGPLKTARRRATLLPGAHTLTDESSPEILTQRTENDLLPISEPLSVLYEPDPAILRAGLVQKLGQQLGAAQLDPDIAYLTADGHIPTPFARAWLVEAWFPFQMKRLREELRQRRVGQITVKKRGSPLEPEALIKELRLSGDQERLVFLTHLRSRPIVILAWPGPV